MQPLRYFSTWVLDTVPHWSCHRITASKRTVTLMLLQFVSAMHWPPYMPGSSSLDYSDTSRFSAFLAKHTIYCKLQHCTNYFDNFKSFTFQHITGVPIKDLVTAGPGLVFVVLPEGLVAMDWCPQLFSFLFFFMLMLLGVTSVASQFEGVVATFTDKYPWVRKWR